MGYPSKSRIARFSSMVNLASALILPDRVTHRKSISNSDGRSPGRRIASGLLERLRAPKEEV